MKDIEIIHGKTYVVTGGTGFLGTGLIDRIISKGGLVRTIARNEGKLIDLKSKYPQGQLEIYFGDVSNPFSLELMFKGEVEGVFHLAAFKHVPAAEVFSLECINSNIVGTLSVLDRAVAHNVKFVIGISTDKAAKVSGVYGATKLLMESLFKQYEALYPQLDFRIVRYGNVLYSTGSVLCKWRDLIQQEKEITITDPNATRFFWTVDSALDLIFECLKDSVDSFPYVPKMKSMRIGDLLDAMTIKYSPNRSIKLNQIGLQKGENLHEVILEGYPHSGDAEKYTIEEILPLI